MAAKKALEATDSFKAPLEQTFGRVLTPFEEFIHEQSAGGIVLIACTVLALVIANSPLAEPYAHLLHLPIGFGIGSWGIEYDLHHWINDGLMALFFFLVGLEIKREVLVGDLADPRAAVLPIVAAAGGMVVPALIYLWFNPTGPASDGWGVPMATDIAFAVGILSLLGSRVPRSLFTFLVALAIVDDLGAVLVIALFYTETIVLEALGFAVLFLGVLILMNLAGIRNPLLNFGVGVLLWLAMLESGVHATIAGILAAWTVPNKPKLEPRRFGEHARWLLERFDRLERGERTLLHSQQQRAVVQAIENSVHKVESPLQRLEHAMHMPVAFFVIPVFALANAGVAIDVGALGDVFRQPVTLGIVSGLVLGKLIGVAGLSLLAILLGIGRLPEGCRVAHIIGAGLLGGIGFTMSIFIAGLGFAGSPELLEAAKMGILGASLLAGVGGFLWLYVLGARSGEQDATQSGSLAAAAEKVP